MAALYLIVAVWFVVLSLGDPRTEFVCDREGGPATIADATPCLGGEAFVLDNLTAANRPSCFQSGFQYCRTVPCSELFDTALNLLCCRQSRTKYFFVLARTRSRRTVFLAFLLLIAGVESNPGPENTSSSATNFGLINARSMIQKTALIHDVISDNRLDLLAVTETWVYENSPDVHKRDAAPAGFSIVHAHRSITPHTRGKQHGGGVALIHREDIRVRVIPTPSTRTFEILLVKVINCTIGLMIAVIYRPPSTKLTDFVTELSDLIDSGSLGPRYIICGDLNCPGPSGTKGLVGKELLEVIDGYSLTQHVVSPTHQSDNLLDHILSPHGTECVKDVTVKNVGLSDHYLVKCKVTCPITRQPIIRATFRNWKRLDLDLFRQRIRMSSACQQPAASADGYAVQLEEDITSILDELAPFCTSTKRRAKPESRWLSAEAVKAKQTRRRLERKWKATGLDAVRKAYRAACRVANRLITESRRAFYAGRVTESSHEPRALWRCVKGLLHSNKSSTTHDRGMSETFSTFFHDKTAKAKAKVSTLRAQLTPNSPKPRPPSAIDSDLLDVLAETSVSEVSKLISKLPNKTSPLDYIHTSVLKSCSDVLSPLIAHLANLSFREGRFPDRFKIAQVTPLIKKDGLDVNDPANYRPISNLNTISKIIERLCLARLTPHVAATGHFNPLQSAYRKHHSTETALLKILDDLYRIIDDRRSAVLVGLDLSAAFDMIEHDTLIERLQTVFGVSGTALSWVETYLREREQVHHGQWGMVFINLMCL